MGRHDGVLHGGRWLRSPVAMRTNQEIVQCPTKGKCSIDEVSKLSLVLSNFYGPESLTLTDSIQYMARDNQATASSTPPPHPVDQTPLTLCVAAGWDIRNVPRPLAV